MSVVDAMVQPSRERPDYVWRNWHLTEESRVKKLVDIWNAEPSFATLDGYKATARRLQSYIQEAMDHGQHLRAMGGGWSFSPAAKTDGILINTQNLNYVFPVSSSSLESGAATDFLLVQCGASILQLNDLLLDRGRCLMTSGASNGQTIVGALSTGTHGAALNFGAVQDYVVGLHVLAGPDRQIWLERATRPILKEAAAKRLGAALVRDDEQFNAALVGIGSCGLICGVMIETVPRYILQVYRARWDGATPGLWDMLDDLNFDKAALPRGSERPQHLQAVFNPHRLDAGPFVTLMYRHPEIPPHGAPFQDLGKTVAGDDAGTMVGHLLDLIPGLGGLIEEALLKSEFKDIHGECGLPGEIFHSTSLHGRLASSAMGIPLGRVKEALVFLGALAKQKPFPGLLALRYVKSSDATLAFTCHERATCVLEMDAPQSTSTREFFEAAWKGLVAQGIPITFHWGKIMPLDPRLALQGYPAGRVDRWRAARKVILDDPKVRKVFTNGMLTSLGLDRD